MSNTRLQIAGVLLLDSSCLLYIIVFLHDLTLSVPDNREWTKLGWIVIFTVYASINTFKKSTVK